MPGTELIEQAQARLHARAHDWLSFAQSAEAAARKMVGQGRSGSSDWLSELWFEFAIGQESTLLAEFSQWLVDSRQNTTLRLPVLSTLVDMAARDPRMQWLIEREDLYDTWVAGTEVPVPNKEWRARHHVFGEFGQAYGTWMREQPATTQTRQKAYLEKYGNAALHSKSLLYYAMCAYAEPTRDQVRGAAIANNPVYDMPRLEVHFPGITGLKAAYEGMGMKNHDLRDGLCKFMDGTAPKSEEAVPENGFDAH